MTPGRGDPAGAEHYEQLRAYTTGHAPRGFIPRGLALLQQRGMVAWMIATGVSNDAVVAGASGPRDRPGDALDARRCALIRLLADVALPLALRRAP